MAFIDREPGEGIATQQINKNYQSSQIIQANATGFGAASDDFMERGIDLNEQLIRNKPATFFLSRQQRCYVRSRHSYWRYFNCR